MATGNTKSQLWGLVINAPTEEKEPCRFLTGLVAQLQDNNTAINIINYYSIIHNRDIKETGELKTIHLHIVLETELTTKSKLIKEISKVFLINPQIISVEKIESLAGATQYLLHKNHPEKAQYKREDIATNNLNKLNDLLAVKLVSKTNNEEEITNILLNEIDIKQVLLKIGLVKTNQYRNLHKELHSQDISELIAENDLLKPLVIKYHDLLNDLLERIELLGPSVITKLDKSFTNARNGLITNENKFEVLFNHESKNED